MAETDKWLSEYGDSHRDIKSGVIYWVAVLALVVGTVGMFWSLPVPAEFRRISPVLNWGSALLMATVVYYFIISMSLAIGMLPLVFGLAAMQIWLADSPWDIGLVSSGLFAVSLLGLYLGHRGAGGLRAVVRDIQLMMIAPVWMLSELYRKIGIPF